MTCAYFAGFDVSTIATGTLTLAVAGSTSVVVTLSSITDYDGNLDQSSLFNHYQTASGTLYYYTQSQNPSLFSILKWGNRSFADALQSDIRDGILAAGDWPSSRFNFDVTFDNDTATYGFSYDNVFSMTWSDAAGKALVGFSSDESGATSYTGDLVPTYAIIPTVDGVQEPTILFEPPGVSTRVVTEGGAGGFGLARTAAPTYRDWVQPFEVKAKTLRLAAATAHPWTFQHLVEHCRTAYPFIVHDGFGESGFAQAFYLRPDAAHLDWADVRDTGNSDFAFNVPFKCFEVARVEDPI